MPLISVVIPVHNVEPYLDECLASVARQTVGDLEVIMVDDGSTDGSVAIAEKFAARDQRFRLISQPNAGLGKARNTGSDAATGEFLAFVDSDDVLPRNAYELLLESLQKTGSDFATGNVYRLTSVGTSQTKFLAKVFVQPQLQTHITRFRPLLADRIVPNKLWRRSFWDEHGFRFPEGMVHEDIPVVLPAQFAARSVDVIAEPVYLYRIREGIDQSDQSITQRRLDLNALLDRVTAVEHVRDHLEREGPRKARRWYEQSVVAEDLMYFLNVLDNADDEYRAVFLDRVNAFLDRTGRHVFDELVAIDRLKWHLVRRRLMPELLEVLRFQRERLRETPPVREGRRWYGDYPFRTDTRLSLPRSVYRLEKELAATPHVDVLRWDGDELRLEGYMFISGIGAPRPDSQRVTVTAVKQGRLRPLRQRTVAIRFKTSPMHRPDATANSRQALCDLEWSGFAATLDPRKLQKLGRWRPGTWELYVTVRAGGVTRRRVRFALEGARPVRAIERAMAGGVSVKASPAPNGKIAVDVRQRWATIRSHGLRDGVARLIGDVEAAATSELTLRAVGPGTAKKLAFPLDIGEASSPAGFSVDVPLAELSKQADAAGSAHPGERDGETVWDLYVADAAGRYRIAVADDVPEVVWPTGNGELALQRDQYGDAALVARSPHAVVKEARWSGDGVLQLGGDLRAGEDPFELVLHSRHRLAQHAFPVSRDPGSGTFEARIAPARVPSLAGELPLREASWELYTRRVGRTRLVPVVLARELYEDLPMRAAVGHKQFALGTTSEQQALLLAYRDLDDSERGGFHQRRLRETAYAAGRAEPLRDAVVYSSFNGRQYSDSPRAIHEELVRREAPFEHLWIVRDGMCRVPAGAGVLRAGSRQHYEALARARYVVANDLLPDWFERRQDQVCLQTWHGTPLKKLGLDLPEMRRTIRRAKQRWAAQAANWQYVVSPNRFSTPLLRGAYAVEGEMLETGLPRDDALAGEHRDAVGREVRRRLGLPEDARVVLYAPTFRDHIVDSRGRYRLDLHLDLDRLRRAVGPDTVLLLRKHHRVADLVPSSPDGFARDVSSYPDGTELLLAADVLVTDYSSMMFDFANTGRPMLFFTYDLELYADQVRGLYFDFARIAPGPLLRTTDELAGALNQIEAIRERYAERYAEFASTFCEFDDGHAAARVADRVFTW